MCTHQVSAPYFPVVLYTLLTVTMFHCTGTKINIVSHSIPHLDYRMYKASLVYRASVRMDSKATEKRLEVGDS